MAKRPAESIIVAAKLRPPSVFAGAVARKAAVERLAKPDPSVLRLIVAPAGWGKSQLLAQWITQHPGPIAYVLMDEADHDLSRFWRHILAAIAAHGIDVDDLVIATRSPELNARCDIIEPLIEALAQTPQLLLILEDLHTVTDIDVLQSIETFIDISPSHVTVGLASRSEPSLRLPRRRLAGQVCDIGVDDLRLDNRQAAAVVGTTGSQLSPALAGDLVRTTEGWPAGIYLAGLSMQRTLDPASFISRFAGDDRLVSDYLSTEVLTALSPDHRDVLSSVAVLERFDAELCDAVLERDGSAKLLDDIARTNQFLISCDDHGRVYRLHQLFREWLLAELDRADPGRRTLLHQRAARALHQRGATVQAVDHALAAGEYDVAASLVGSVAARLLFIGATGTLDRWLDRIPVRDDPAAEVAVATLRGWTALMRGDPDDLARQCIRANQALAVVAEIDSGPRMVRELSMLESYRSVLAGQFTEAVKHADDASQADFVLRAEPAIGWLGASARYWYGDPEEERFRASRDRAQAAGDGFTELLCEAFLALLALDRDDLDAAGRWTSRAFETATRNRIHNFGQMAPAHLARSRLHLRHGEPDRAAVDGRRALDLAQRRSDLPVQLAATLSVADARRLLGLDTVDLLRDVRQALPQLEVPGVVGRQLSLLERLLRVEGIDMPPVGQHMERLTDRELSLLRLLPGTLNQRQLGEVLHVSFNTVKTHNRQIYRKLGVSSRDEAVARARALGLL
ncbi:MAG: LuxR C-terminal-related transcriptional regulator [Actinomycetota bacterium]